MKHTTHKLTNEQKEALFNKHKDLISLVHTLGDMALRKQLKVLYCMLHPDADITDVEFAIAELIMSGFLLQVQIQKPSKTQMLYLSKYPRSHYYNKETTGDVPALNFTNIKIYNQIFKVEYIIQHLIPEMKQKNLLISEDNLISYLYWSSSNLLLPGTQYSNADFYERFKDVCEKQGIALDYDFTRDYEIAAYEKDAYISKQLKQNISLQQCKAKIQRDAERDSYTSDIEKGKYFYNLNNFHKQGYVIEDITTDTIKIAYFDVSNNMNVKKLYKTLSYIYMMLCRYCTLQDVELHLDFWTWDKDRAEHLTQDEAVEAFDFYNQEASGLSKKCKAFQESGLLPRYWDCINTTYKSMDIYEKYNIRPQA